MKEDKEKNVSHTRGLCLEWKSVCIYVGVLSSGCSRICMCHTRLDYFMMEEYVCIVNPRSEVFFYLQHLLDLVHLVGSTPSHRCSFGNRIEKKMVSHTHKVYLGW